MPSNAAAATVAKTTTRRKPRRLPPEAGICSHRSIVRLKTAESPATWIGTLSSGMIQSSYPVRTSASNWSQARSSPGTDVRACRLGSIVSGLHLPGQSAAEFGEAIGVSSCQVVDAICCHNVRTRRALCRDSFQVFGAPHRRLGSVSDTDLPQDGLDVHFHGRLSNL
jgi:hypothetical protein